jgi:flavin-dependent dehydrogenase
MDLSPDLLVIGGGMAGLTAAARASRDGQRATVVEVSSDVGGSGRFAGYIWTAPTDAVMDEQNPDGDEALKRALVERFDDAVDWIRSTGVEAGPSQRILSFGQGHGFDTNQYVDTCRRIVTESGGQVLLSTTTDELLVDEGAVVGARLRLPTDEVVEIRARNTVLATGGFQADPAMREKLLGPMRKRCTRLPGSTLRCPMTPSTGLRMMVFASLRRAVSTCAWASL